MKPLALLAALLATVSLAAPSRAATRVYGLDQAQVLDTMHCSSWTAIDIRMQELVAAGVPYEKVLPNVLALAAEGSPWPRGELEQRLQATYAQKPASGTDWARERFVACLATRHVPLQPDPAGKCYMLTYLLSALVPIAKERGLDRQKYITSLTPDAVPAAQRGEYQRMLGNFWDGDGEEPRSKAIRDLKWFLSCTAPDAAPVSDDATPAAG
jgi:hypothetical protein